MNIKHTNYKKPRWDVLNGIHMNNNCGGKIIMSPHCACSRCTGRKIENDGIKRFYYITCIKCNWSVGGAENVTHRLTFNIKDLNLH